MKLGISRRSWSMVGLLSMVAGVVVLMVPTASVALPQYAAATGQPCATCHVNPAGGGARNATGQAFEAIPTHSTDPAGAFAQATAPKPAAPAAAPAASSAVSFRVSGAASDDSVTYAVVIVNSGDKAVTNVFFAASVPASATFKSAATAPKGAGFLGGSDGAVTWLVNSVAAKGSVGPFVYTVSKGSAADLSVNAFAHWTGPSEATAASARVQPISNDERLAIDQAINDKLNNVDNNLTLWLMQPGTGPRMDDLLRHFNMMWFAAQAGNWEFADFEADDQVPGTVRRIDIRNPRIAPSMDNWSSTLLTPLLTAIDNKDLSAFNTAYDNAIGGCNSCHAATPEGSGTMSFVKVSRPTTPMFSNLDYAGQ